MYTFCNDDLNKFFLLLRRDIYPYEYVDSWERFDENTTQPKKAFYSKSNLENITDKDYEHVKKVWETFEINILVNIMIYMFNVIHFCFLMYLKTLEVSALKYMNLILLIFLSAPGLAWQACLKKTGVKLELLTDIDMLLMVEKGTRGGIYQAIHRYAKVNNKYMKNYDKDLISSYLMYLDANNLYG